MSPSPLVSLLGLISLAGCTTVPLPPELATITLDRVASKSIAVHEPKLVVKDGQLLLDGWVYRQYGASITTRTHLDISFLDQTGRELRGELVRFAPRDLRRGGGHRTIRQGHYTLLISSLPPGTVKIQVRAHDSSEHQS